MENDNTDKLQSGMATGAGVFGGLYLYSDLKQSDIELLISRNADSDNSITQGVESILSTVKIQGDRALLDFTEKFDGIRLEKLYLDKQEIQSIAANIGIKERAAIDTAYQNIRTFHESQLQAEQKVETMPGVTCWRETRAVEKAGLYIPGGSAVLPSTFLMLGIPAGIAGCKQIVVCSPPQKDGLINAYVAYVATLLDIDRVYLCGGAQAVAAMAYGTESIPKVDKIFGPGNQYVTRAKTIIQSTTQTAIDMPAGPSEVLVIADDSAQPVFVAADLLAQAEHGADSQAVLVATSAAIVEEVKAELSKQLELLPRKEIAAKAMANSYVVLTESLEQAMAFSNEYAPEHLILATGQWQQLVPLVSNAGSVFLGNLTPESAGDYASGTNHTLPTSAYARSYSGVSVDSFVKKITFQHLSPEGVMNIGPTVETLAELEGLRAHKNAMSVRAQNISVPTGNSGQEAAPEALSQDIRALLRDNIKKLVPYSSARDEFKGEASVFLDANENSFGSPLSAEFNRYPDPLQYAVKKRLSEIKGVPAQNIFLGNGSDEAIDILFRAFCRPGQDNVITVPPTYGMYEVSANINDVQVKEVPLLPDYQLDLEGIAEAVDTNTKLIFICSPNNPTANSINREDVETILVNFKGLVVVDEAYINYSRQKSFIQELTEYSNLVVLQTLSKAWGLAGLRIGMAFACEDIIDVFNKVKPPYNINQASQQLALEALNNVDQVNNWIRRTVELREILRAELATLPFVLKVFPSDANFILVKTTDARGIYQFLVDRGIIVRDRSKVVLCEGSLRITIGTEEENQVLINTLKKFKPDGL